MGNCTRNAAKSQPHGPDGLYVRARVVSGILDLVFKTGALGAPVAPVLACEESSKKDEWGPWEEVSAHHD